MYQHFRCQKAYRKRKLCGQDRRGQIVNRVDIIERPIAADNRQQLDNYEEGQR